MKFDAILIGLVSKFKILNFLQPNGATNTAGANPYAAKLQTSPSIISDNPIHQMGLPVGFSVPKTKFLKCK